VPGCLILRNNFDGDVEKGVFVKNSLVGWVWKEGDHIIWKFSTGFDKLMNECLQSLDFSYLESSWLDITVKPLIIMLIVLYYEHGDLKNSASVVSIRYMSLEKQWILQNHSKLETIENIQVYRSYRHKLDSGF